MKILDLFSGIGGFSLGLERAGMETVAFCEIDKFCQKVLKKHWPDVPIHSDIRTLKYDGNIDLICGGYPCQPFSVAGNRRGKEDDRHLWPEMFSVIKKCQPSWVLGENVAGHFSLGLDKVLFDLESEGYETRVFSIPASGVNAPHKRERLWVIGHAKHNGQPATKKPRGTREAVPNHTEGEEQASQFKRTDVLFTNDWCKRVQGDIEAAIRGQQTFSWCEDIRRVEDYHNRPDLPKPLIYRDDYGFSARVDRLRALGNAVVPLIPEIIGRFIMEIQTNLKKRTNPWKK